jgi:flavin-dependent dehydrogenase
LPKKGLNLAQKNFLGDILGAMKKEIKIAGAGISGLTAAIILAKNGYQVTVYEVANHPGGRFKGDWQNLANWTKKTDILDYLKQLGLKINFFAKPCHKMKVLIPGLKEIKVKTSRPLFYSVKRGEPPESIDNGLLKQAQKLGAKVIFNTPKGNSEVDLIATGPRRADGYVSGINFTSPSPDTIIILIDKKLSESYSYVEIINGQGTIASYHSKIDQNNLPAFRKKMEKLLGIKISTPKPFSARGSFSLDGPIKEKNSLFLGEAAGFQDALAGFGMILSIDSAYLAAQSIIKKKNYLKLCQKEILPRLKASYVNRNLYQRIPNLVIDNLDKIANKKQKGYYRKLLSFFYHYSLCHKLLFPVFKKF